MSLATALSVGLKIDVDALPGNLLQQLKHGQVNLTTRQLRLLYSS